MNMLSASPISLGLIIGALEVVGLLGTVGLFVVIVVANRAEADPTHRRPLAVYLFGASFVTIWTALIGSVAIVASLVELIGSHPATFSQAIHPVGDASARGAVLGAIVLLVSVAILVTHLRAGMRLALATDPESPLTRRVGQSYVAAVAFVSVLVTAIAVVVVAYAIFQLIAPGVFLSSGRIPTLRMLLDALYVALAAGALVWTHLRLPVSPMAKPASVPPPSA